ncbi:MAG: von Willebrand factor type A domain-containing protein [Planctomycetales bacterium]|nr:von Willebrand factor type A domain-containing protein [Planctomycetales bacterium]
MASESADHHETIEERATAFVFGEMDRDEAMEFMRAVDASPELRATVASIRDAVDALQIEFEEETEGVRESNRQAIALAIREAHVEAPPVTTPDSDLSPRQWPTGLAVAATLLLASGLTLPAMNRVITANTETKGYKEQIRKLELENERLRAERLVAQQELERIHTVSPVRSSVADADLDSVGTGDDVPVGQVGELELNVANVAADTGASIDPISADTDSHVVVASGSGSVDDSSRSQHVTESEVVASQPKPMVDHQDDLVSNDPDSRAEMGTSPVDDRPARIVLDENDRGMPPLLGQRSPSRLKPMVRQDPHRVVGDFASGDHVMKEIMEGAKASLELMFGAGLTSHHGGDASQSTVAVADVDLSPESIEELEEPLIDENQIQPMADNPFVTVASSPLSAFPLDTDTAAYDRLRTSLSKHDHLPLPRSVRIEEMINFFDYDYAPPTDDRPFAASLDVAECPWNPKHRLARIGIKGKVLGSDRPPSNLVFLIDVSGSMNQPTKLPLVVEGIKTLLGQLGARDSLGIVVYAGANGVVLDATSGDRKKAIVDALGRLKSGNPTTGVKGIELAYNMARDHRIAGGTNRIVLCSDGNLNAGIKNKDQLAKLSEKYAGENIFLTVLGFGADNQRNPSIDRIVNNNHGSYSFINSEDDVANVLIEQIHGESGRIAKDVSIQVEFNPMEVGAYRLLGYENQVFSSSGLNDADDVAGEVKSGQTITALYEIIPRQVSDADDPDADSNRPDDLKYQMRVRYSDQAASGELMTVKLRYTLPTKEDKGESGQSEFSVKDSPRRLDQTDPDFQFAASVAAFGMLLRQSPHKGKATFEMVQEYASAGAVNDQSGYRDEFLSLVKRAKRLADE